MKKWLLVSMLLTFCLSFGGTAFAGPYTDIGVPGFVGPDGDGVVSENNYVNPIFQGWATGYIYEPFDYDAIYNYNPTFADPENTLGPVTGNNFDIASLGDMDATEIAAWQADPVSNPGPGQLTLSFDNPIFNGAGYDFAAFENGFISGGGAGVAGQMFAELGYVEVSTDGFNFARFDSVSLTPDPVGAYGTIDPTDAYNLVGKHPNAYGDSWGTGFDLDELLDNDLVLADLVDLDEINYVRIVDIPGSGDFVDSQGNPIYDAWVTWGSGGVDFEAMGAINVSPVPLPTAAWLLGSGMIGLIGIRRRRA